MAHQDAVVGEEDCKGCRGCRSRIGGYLLNSTAALAIAVAVAAIGPGTAWADPVDPQEINIPAQSVGDALKEFARQTDIEVLFAGKDVAKLKSNGVSGAATRKEAIGDLLAGTGLVFEFEGDDLLVVRVPAEPASRIAPVRTNSRTPGDNGRRLADAGAAAGLSDDDEDGGDRVEEIIVTGSHIRGTEASIGSKLETITREDIERGGFGTVQEVMHSLTNNFKGGINEDAVSGVNDGNFGGGMSVNLRGLGAGATLTLVNGRRFQEGGRSGGFVDISTIPASAIDRVEVLADGASAVYGSDAIGGVVNVILRNDYDGAETGLRIGTVTEGGSQEYRASQLLGKSWDTGHALVSYEYYKRESLGREKRPFSASSDLRALGGDDFRTDFGVPGNILDPATFQPAYAIPLGTDGILTPSDLLAGEVNLFNDNPGRNLLLDQERHSFFVSMSQKLGEPFELFAEGFYSDKDFKDRGGAVGLTLAVPSSNPFFVDPFGGSSVVFIRYNSLSDFGPGVGQGDTTDYNGVFGAKVDLGRDWQAQFYGAYGRRLGDGFSTGVNIASLNAALADPDPATAFNPFGDGDDNNPRTIESIRSSSEFQLESNLWSVNAVADGALFRLPAGDAKLAVGAEYYETTFDTFAALSGAETNFGRGVTALFGEVLVPLFGESNGRPGFERLMVSASTRYENYDDVGSTTNPKIGILWTLLTGLNVRGSYGTSFKAPDLPDLDETSARNASFIFNLPDSSSATGSTLSLLLFGNNRRLKNETATAWTLGFDFVPTTLPELSLSMTYYNIQFKDRIAGAAVSFAILDQEDRFAEAITRNPGQALLDEFCGSANFLGDPSLCGTLPIGAIVDFRLNNTAETKTDGLDFNLRYRFETENVGHFDLRLSGTYIFSFDEAFSPTSPIVELVDTISNPIGLRMRNSVSWHNNSGMSVAAFINFSGSYTDNVSSPERNIGSWATADLTLAYNTGEGFGWMGLTDTALSLSVRNLFNTDPPFVNNSLARIGYDPENAGPLGRFISFNITKRW